MKAILNQLFDHQALSRQEAFGVLTRIGQGDCNPSQTAAFLTVYLMRPITVEELEGFRDALLELCLPVSLDGGETLDVCGTGGDGKQTFNISTLSAFVAAACGIRVAKHGNYGISSISGSSNVMEQLGYRFTTDSGELNRQLDRAGICFLHAPLFHPAMKYVAPVRRELGVKTFFNMLGPLVNPARPALQCTGVFSLELARLYHYLLQQSTRRYTVLHSLDGYDEISLTGKFKKYDNSGEDLINPAQWGLPRLEEKDLFGGNTLEDAAALFINILQGRGTALQNAVVVANAAAALQCAWPEITVAESIHQAGEALESGRAYAVLNKLLINS